MFTTLNWVIRKAAIRLFNEMMPRFKTRFPVFQAARRDFKRLDDLIQNRNILVRNGINFCFDLFFRCNHDYTLPICSIRRDERAARRKYSHLFCLKHRAFGRARDKLLIPR